MDNGSKAEAEIFHLHNLHTCKQECRIKNIEHHIENLVVSTEILTKKIDVYLDDTKHKFRQIEIHLEQLNEFLSEVVKRLDPK